MRVGIYGGSFDPPHIGHVVLAQDAVESLELDRLFVVPTGIQPHKAEKLDGASPRERLEMARLAFAGVSAVTVSEDEVDRPGLSFTVDTVATYASRYPGSKIFLLMGEDSFNSFEGWKNPAGIRELCDLVLLSRESGGGEPGARYVSERRVDISSSEIRERRRSGKSIAGFVPDAVLKYIEDNNLYAPPGAARE